MKFLTLFFLTICTFFGGGFLSASQIDSDPIDYYLKQSWMALDNEVYFCIDLADELEFSSNYSTFKVKNGVGCEIGFKPSEGKFILSSEGYELQNVELYVELVNTNNPNEVDCNIITKSFYSGYNLKGLVVSGVLETTREGFINTSSIDLTESPVFFILDKKWKEGAIKFQSSKI